MRGPAPLAVIGTPAIPEFFSARVSCHVPQPLQFGADLGSLCLRGGSRSARFFGTSERFWIDLQARHDLEVEKDRLGDALDGTRPLSVAS